jgi:hypothetical protein
MKDLITAGKIIGMKLAFRESMGEDDFNSDDVNHDE